VGNIRSKLALAAGIALLVAYYFVTRLMRSAHESSGWMQALLEFLRPGYRQHPGQWLAIETGTLLAGVLGLLLLGTAVADGPAATRLRAVGARWREHWRPAVWFFLLGTNLLVVVGFATFLGNLSPLQFRTSMQPVLALLGYVAPLGTCYCAARLLFGRQSWRTDQWIGYASATAALFTVAWRGLGIIGLSDPMRLIGASPVSGLASMFSGFVYVVVACLMAWACLTLARKGAAAMIGVPRTIAVLYPLAGAIVLSGLMPKVIGFQFMARGLQLGYLVADAFLVAMAALVALLCIVDGARLLLSADLDRAAAQASEAQQRVGWLRRVWGTPRAARFWIDLAQSFLATLVLIGVTYLFVAQIPVIATPFLFPLIVFGFLIGPIGVFVVGMLRGRPGVAVAPVLILLAIAGYRFANQAVTEFKAQAAVDEAASLNIYPLGEPTQKHGIVAIEYSAENSACSPICQRILLASNYAVAMLDESTGDWRVYRKAHGAATCTAPEQIESYITLLSWGYADTCFAGSRERAGSDALVIRQSKSKASPLRDLMPKGVHGDAFEFRERIAGTDTVLGRVVTGSVPPQGFSSRESKPTILKMTDYEFFAAALRLPIALTGMTDDSQLGEVVAEFELLLNHPTVGSKAQDGFKRLGNVAKSSQAAASLQAAVARMIDSSNPDRIKLGLRTLNSLKLFGLDFAKPRVAALLVDPDPKIASVAMWELFAFGEDLEFAKEPLAALIFDGRAPAENNGYRSLFSTLGRVNSPFPDAARREAKNRLANMDALEDDQMVAILAIIWRGNAETRQEAVDWIFGLEGEQFERALYAASRRFDALSPGDMNIRLWTDADIQKVLARLPAIPDGRIVNVVRSIQHQWAFRRFRADVQKALYDRADALKAKPNPDPKLVKSIEDVARRLLR
jgi:hypothetical protein